MNNIEKLAIEHANHKGYCEGKLEQVTFSIEQLEAFAKAYASSLQSSEPVADDVRKDAERYLWIRANPKLDICGTDEIAEFDAMIDRAIDKARE